MNDSNFLHTNDINVMQLAQPTDTMPTTVTIVYLPIRGIETNSILNRSKFTIGNSETYANQIVLPLLVISKGDITEWDPKTLPFYTLLQESFNYYRGVYVGGQDVDKYYVPLL